MIINKKVLISILAFMSLQVFAEPPSTDANVEQKATNVARWYATLGSPKTQKKAAKKKARKKKSARKKKDTGAKEVDALY